MAVAAAQGGLPCRVAYLDGATSRVACAHDVSGDKIRGRRVGRGLGWYTASGTSAAIASGRSWRSSAFDRWLAGYRHPRCLRTLESAL